MKIIKFVQPTLNLIKPEILKKKQQLQRLKDNFYKNNLKLNE
jgi:hypothetical protein